MPSYTILMSNLGHAIGINGGLAHHLRYAHRHVYCSPAVQQKSLRQLSTLIEQEDPDICCFVEIDKGSANSANFNQLESILGAHYRHFDIDNKYGQSSRLHRLSFTRGKSNAFMSKQPLAFEKLYFDHGSKRLIYKLRLDENTTLFFAHFSLNKDTRFKQLLHMRELIQHTEGNTILMGDFNVLTGLQELAPLLNENNMVLLNREDRPTFTFHRRKLVLDLCLCSHPLANASELRIIPQPYSDHAALLLKVTTSS